MIYDMLPMLSYLSCHVSVYTSVHFWYWKSNTWSVSDIFITHLEDCFKLLNQTFGIESLTRKEPIVCVGER